jgi:hypothetical protein
MQNPHNHNRAGLARQQPKNLEHARRQRQINPVKQPYAQHHSVHRHQVGANRQTALIAARYAVDEGAAYQNRRETAQAKQVDKPVQALPRLLLAQWAPSHTLRQQSKDKQHKHQRRGKMHVALDDARNRRNQLAVEARQRQCPVRLANVDRQARAQKPPLQRHHKQTAKAARLHQKRHNPAKIERGGRGVKLASPALNLISR